MKAKMKGLNKPLEIVLWMSESARPRVCQRRRKTTTSMRFRSAASETNGWDPPDVEVTWI